MGWLSEQPPPTPNRKPGWRVVRHIHIPVPAMAASAAMPLVTAGSEFTIAVPAMAASAALPVPVVAETLAVPAMAASAAMPAPTVREDIPAPAMAASAAMPAPDVPIVIAVPAMAASVAMPDASAGVGINIAVPAMAASAAMPGVTLSETLAAPAMSASAAMPTPTIAETVPAPAMTASAAMPDATVATAPTLADLIDLFNRANATTLGTDWTHRYRSTGTSGELKVVSNSAAGSTASRMYLSTYNTVVNTNDHTVEVTLGANFANITYIALPIRSSTTNTVYALLKFRNSSLDYACRIYTKTNYSIGADGALGTLRTDGATDPGNWASGEIFGFKGVGTLYTLYKIVSGVTTTLATWTDSGGAHPTGSGQRSVGLGVNSNTTTGVQIDGWEAKDL